MDQLLPLNFFKIEALPIPNRADEESHPLNAWMNRRTSLMSEDKVMEESLTLHDFFD